MKKIILITFISLLTFVTVSHSKIYYFNKCYDDFKKNFSEMNMGQNSFIIDTEKKTVVNNQYRNDTNKSVANKYNIEKIDNNIVRAINEENKTFLINLTIFLTEKKVENSFIGYDTKTQKKTNVKTLFICE
jgi:hypothetical protein